MDTRTFIIMYDKLIDASNCCEIYWLHCHVFNSNIFVLFVVVYNFHFIN